MPHILATFYTKAVTDFDCGSRCNKAVTTLARRFGSSMENQRLIVRCLRYRWWSRRSTVVVSSRSLPCAVVLSFVYSPCHALNVVYLGWQVLVFALCGQYCRTYHSLSVVWLVWTVESCRYQVTRQCKHRQDWRPPRPTKLEHHAQPWHLALGWRYMLCPFWGLLHHLTKG